jgi:hypothetical protein
MTYAGHRGMFHGGSPVHRLERAQRHTRAGAEVCLDVGRGRATELGGDQVVLNHTTGTCFQVWMVVAVVVGVVCCDALLVARHRFV